MTFVGIVSDRISNKQASRILINEDENNKYILIFINNKNVTNYRNVKFETILIDEILEDSIDLQKILNNAEYIIVNSDIKENFGVLNDIKANVITYGFTEKSTVSISSVEDENIMLSIQRGIKRKDGIEIEKQEISIKKLAGINMHITIGLSIINLIYSQTI